MATKNPGDVTGRKRDENAAKHVEEIQARAEEMSLATAEAERKLTEEVIDATVPGRPTVIVDSVVRVGDQSGDRVTIRVIADIEAMTFGAGNTYSFKAGQKYDVTKDVARHLNEKGYLAGVI